VLTAAEAVEGPPEKALQRADMQRSLRARYRRIKFMWRLLGIRYEDTDPAFYSKPEFAIKVQEVRQVLRLTEDRQPTLVMKQWYPPGQKKSANDPYLETFVIVGKLPASSRADVNFGDFSAPPRYILGETERNGQREVHASVLLAAHGCFPPASPTEVRWRWNPLTPDVDHDPEIYRFGYCTNENLRLLVHHAARLYYKTTRPGRTRDVTKHWPPGTEDEFFDAVDEILATRERDGVTLTKVELLADAMGMSRSALFEMFERVPEASERFKEHKRRPRRR
jgi:hypothetical protein